MSAAPSRIAPLTRRASGHDEEGLDHCGVHPLQGVGAYARYQTTASAAVVTAEHKPAEGFLVRAEFRRDWSNERFFPGRLGDADLREVRNTALVGGVWWFGKAGVW
jgi:hypothetical protein